MLGAPPCPGPATDPTSSAHHIKVMAWSTGWNAVNERRELTASESTQPLPLPLPSLGEHLTPTPSPTLPRTRTQQAESTQQVAVEHASSLAERLPEELITAVRWMCVHAARKVAFEEPLPGEKPRKHAAEVEKSKLAFQKQQAVVAQHVPAALATSLAEIGAHAARYAARSHLGLDAPLERAAFEHAAAEVERLQGSLPRLWRGTPIPTGPIADELKWMCWNAAWHAANERAGKRADAGKAQLAHFEHAARLAQQLAAGFAESCRELCWHAAWRAANEQSGRSGEAEEAREAEARLAATVEEQVPAALAAALTELATRAARHAACSLLGKKAEAKLHRSCFERAANEVHRLGGRLPLALPTAGAPSSHAAARRKRQKAAQPQHEAAHHARAVANSAAFARRRLALRTARQANERALALLAADERRALASLPFPVLIDPSRLVELGQQLGKSRKLRSGGAAAEEGAAAAAPEAVLEVAEMPPPTTTRPLESADAHLNALPAFLGMPDTEAAHARDARAPGSGDDEGGGGGGGGGVPKRSRELCVGDAVEARFGTGERELWWPGTIMQLWSNGDVDVRYDDGDFEAQKPRSRVRPLRGAGAGVPDAPKLKHARHSHVAFLVGRPAGWGAPGGGLGRSGLRLAMLEEGLFASADGALTKPHVQVHWLAPCAAEPPQGLKCALQFDVSRRAGTASLLCAVAMAQDGSDGELNAPARERRSWPAVQGWARLAPGGALYCGGAAAPLRARGKVRARAAPRPRLPILRLCTAGWDERGCPFYRLSVDEFERVRGVARQAGERHAAEAARLDAQQVAEREAVIAKDLERRKRNDPFGEVVARTRGRPR